ncbi:8-amino-3,8-dideoxy-manno-octulosonate cytidylyltransferase [Paenibacillus auburnensis]|uniref:8-amino-3,8-dideoxy-manno-octulosonate cytidylyltransferase n=1 Tax=Paenibacillus auburnensis TaxID=2905649 RepID=A0ABM9BVY1_9BACL|nr:glycosyltransferase family protein [Paenibacillus auburnensis]CAH1195724.1 8-amino-3,8-dideoxy-manno-octulosonate cytidylyltransferase [Paenibacillus auburnensis]
MKIVAVIQARMGSTRLPGKIMKEVAGKSVLEYQIEQVRRSKTIDQIVIATTTKDTEQPIIDLCKRMAVDYYRGPEDDVLSRYYQAACWYGADIVVRLTSDCPLLDPAVIDRVINVFLSRSERVDYVSNTIERTYPRGYDVEVFSMKVLEQTFKEAGNAAEREHVTLYLYQHPEVFRLGQVKHSKDLSSYRLTVDTEEDFELMSRLITALCGKRREGFTLDDVITLLQENPDWVLINAHIEQKKADGHRRA